jgi:hypothetical protein
MNEPLESYLYRDPAEILDRKHSEDKKELRRKEVERKNKAAFHRAQVKQVQRGRR